jgi:hypothetical protein
MKSLIYFLVFVLIITPVHATSIGVSPDNLYFEVNQKPVTKHITIFNPNNQEVYYTITGHDFFKFSPGKRIIPKKSSSVVYVEVDPKNLVKGIYNSTILVIFSHKNREGFGLIPAAAIKVTIKTKNENTKRIYKIRNVVYKDSFRQEPQFRLLTEKTDKRIKGSLISLTIVIVGLGCYFVFERKLFTKQ